MKNILFITVSVLLALLIGCQENMVNEPTDTLLKGDPITTASNQNPVFNTIKIEYELEDPTLGACKMTGKFIYAHKVITESMSPLGLTRVSVQLCMKSILDYLARQPRLQCCLDCKSYDVMYLNEQGFYLLDKTYPLDNRKDVVVYVQYLVTEEDVSVSRVNLIQIES